VVRRVDADAVGDVLLALGVRPSDFLSADRILVVEGPTDAAIMRRWFAKELQRVAVIPGHHGGDLAWQIDSIDSLLDAANRLETRILFLRDRDELTDDSIDQLTANGVVHVLDHREIENYLLEPAALYEVMDARATDGGGALPDGFNTAGIAEKLRAYADQLRDVVVLKRVAANIKPLRLIARADVRDIIAQGASKTALLERFQENLPTGDIADDVAAAWDVQTAELEENWSADWMKLAPGADLLDRLFREAGLQYDKLTDGERIASLVEPPEELRNALAALVTDGDVAV
jgi:hypothetical protein